MEVKGYKAFNSDMTNRYGLPFEVGSRYKVDGEVKFGNDGNGFHMCKELCDVFRYFDKDNVVVAEVTGTGRITKFDDDYNGYYDMYAVEEITIDRIMTREEIIEIMLCSHELANKKFLSTFVLTEEEKMQFLKQFKKNISILEYLFYYQFGYKDVFHMSSREKEECLRKVCRYG